MNKDLKKILIVAAHPDDEILGCGGLIHKSIQDGSNIRVVFLAEGTTSRFDHNNSEKDEIIEREIIYRENCAKEALSSIGLSITNIYFSRRKCCQLDTYPRLDLTKNIEFHINDFSPTCLITHFAKDTNIDHRICYEAVLPAIRPINKNSPNLVLSFEIISSTELNYAEQFKPNYFFNISSSIEMKIKACLKYDKEIGSSNNTRSLDLIKALALYRGAQAGYKYAEGFKLIVKR